MSNLIPNPHPGIILKTEFLEPLSLSQNKLAKLIFVPANRIHQIINGERKITADTDLRLCEFFGLSEGYFLHLQDAYDLLEAKRNTSNELKNIRTHSHPYFLNALHKLQQKEMIASSS